MVQRVKKTIPQKELNIQERQNNLKKAFNIGTDVVKLNKTILVDDIYTTGSTLDAVALELKKHGVESVYFITLCIGEAVQTMRQTVDRGYWYILQRLHTAQTRV